MVVPLNKPHRSVKGAPTGASRAKIEFRLTLAEYMPLKDQFPVLVPDTASEFARSIGCHEGTLDDCAHRLGKWILSQTEVSLIGRLENGKWAQWEFRAAVEYTPRMRSAQAASAVSFDASGNPHNTDFNTQPDRSVVVTPLVQGSIYVFRSSRLTNLGAAFGPGEDLTPDGSNLTGVLDRLQRNRAKFEQYMRLVEEVLLRSTSYR